MIGCIMQDREGNESIIYYDPLVNNLFDENVKQLFPTKDKLESKNDNFNIRISLGHDCNFRCKYCCQQNTIKIIKQEYSLDKLVDKLMDISGNRKISNIQFWGGEPLIYFEKIKEFHSLFIKRDISPDIFFLSTNGSLLDEYKTQWLLDNNISTTISYDGLGQHLRGKDILEDPIIFKSINKLLNSEKDIISFCPVMTNENISIIQYIDFLKNKLNMDLFNIGDVSAPIIIDKNSKKYAPSISMLKQYSREFYLNLLSGNLLQLSSVYQLTKNFIDSIGIPISYDKSACFVSSRDTITIDLQGNTLTCQNFGSSMVDESGDNHRLGDIFDIDKYEDIPLPNMTKLKNRFKKCKDCLVVGICKGGCPYSPNEYHEYNCQSNYYQKLPIFGLALYELTGKLLKEIIYD